LSREGFVVPCDTTGFKQVSLFDNQAMTLVRGIVIFLLLVWDLCLQTVDWLENWLVFNQFLSLIIKLIAGISEVGFLWQ
jgi:hypothetical protein